MEPLTEPSVDGEPVQTVDEDAPDGGGQPPKPAEGGRGLHRTVFEWVGLVALALIIALLIKTFLFQAFYIPSESMVPTLKIHDRVLVNKLSYKLHAVHRGDIVVFESPANADPGIKDLVKRVIALPGERVDAHDGHVYVDGKRLAEKYLPTGITTAPFETKRPLPADSYWVMGDNRGNSKDSRVFGPIKKSEIIGRVFLRIWPITRIDIM